MVVRSLLVFLTAGLVIASGTAGSFYLAGAQEADRAEITLSAMDAEPASEVNVSGAGFDTDSEVSIYLLSAAQTELTNGSAFILQEISNQSIVTSPELGSSNFLDYAIDALEDLLNFDGNQETDTDTAQGNVIVALEGAPDSGTLSLECDDQELAQGNTSAGLVSLTAPPGMYEECSISISDGDATDIGEFGSLTITPDPDEDYEGSLVGSAGTDELGSFETSLTTPRAEGEYAVLAVQGNTATVSRLSVISAERGLVADDTTGQNTTDDAVNETGLPLIVPLENATITENQTETNQTDTSGDASVQLAEENAEPGEPLPVIGEGFPPNTPVQIFINNVQITNIVTNIEGSFNTVIIVPTTVNAGDAEIVVTTEQRTIVENVVIVEPDGLNQGPATLQFTSISATDNAHALQGAPVTIFDASNGQIVDSDKTPMTIELEAGTYSVFYSDFSNFNFQSAEPGTWTDTPDGGSGLITVREGRNATVTAIYSEEPAPTPPQRETVNSLTLRAVDVDGEPLPGMFVTIYDADAGEKIEQGFTELAVEDLPPGTYPMFFANFDDLAFVSASPGSWVQTPFGGAGLVTIPDDGEDHDVTVTAVYDRITETAQEQFNIQAPLDIRGNIFSITSNETRPEGPFVMSGTFALHVDDEGPVRASFSAYFMSAREDSNENVDLETQRSRDHDAFHIVDFDPRVARPVGLDSYLVSGTADLLLNGDMYSNDERIEVMVRGGEELTPASVEIEFQGEHRYSAANRLETLYGTVTSGFQ